MNNAKAGETTDLEKQIDDQFLDVPLRCETMLIYSVRTAILKSVTNATKDFRGTVLDVGCGFMPYRKLIESNRAVEKYIGMDLEDSELYGQRRPDLKWNGITIPLGNESVDCVMATEFLEHYAEPETALREILRVMKHGGRLFGTVPFVWNLHEIPHDEYRYTPYSLERHLSRAGFIKIEINALGGWNASLAQMIGLWLTFSKMSDTRRKTLRRILFPFYKWLIRTDVAPAEFDGRENSMFTGLSFIARK
ncbi:MAG TPA: class I SAM-dependent methyltransferase [Pyrinomonadaceae bacterium]|nr:class I SAM-dependent methyltransferase [Pyrinomonadaceae bacterium]